MKQIEIFHIHPLKVLYMHISMLLIKKRPFETDLSIKDVAEF